MTQENTNRMAFLEGTADRVLERIRDLDPATPEFNYALNNLGILLQVSEQVKYADNIFDSGEPETLATNVIQLVQPQEHKETEEEAHKTPEPDAEIPPQPKPVVETKAKPAGKTVSIDEVRKHLVALAKSGADLNGIFEPFGASKLSEVPEECFDDLLKLADSRAEGC